MLAFKDFLLILRRDIYDESIHTSAKINWISALQGMAIVLVVMNHVRLYDASIGDDYAFVHRIRDVFQPFFMATFFFISGMLLYYTRMSSEWRTFQLYKDKRHTNHSYWL